MANRPVQRKKIVVDPNFYIPADVEDIVHDPLYDPYQDEYEGAEGDNADNVGLTAPVVVEIVSQKLRTVKGGTQVVDVVIEVSSIDGAKDYEHRTAKI